MACLVATGCGDAPPSASTAPAATAVEFPSSWPWSADIEPLRADNGVVASGALAASEADLSKRLWEVQEVRRRHAAMATQLRDAIAALGDE